MANNATNLFSGLFGSRNQRLIKRYRGLVAATNAQEEKLTTLDDDSLRAKTLEFKERYAKTQDLDALLPEAFAVVREAARRTLKMRHFDVQLIGGMTLHEGKIAEMRTGEGKTLVATLPVYLNALTGRGVHVVTVNEYLAQRDAEWMSPVYRFLGLEVDVIKANQSTDEKRAAYAADITYGTNNEFGFDYLRDNLAFRVEDRVQRQLNYAIVDEVDSILVDEARTPLIISGQSDESTELYGKINLLIPKLRLHDVRDDAKSNAEIESNHVELIGIDGKSLGEMSLSKALGIAEPDGYHIVEMDKSAKPMRCKLIVPGDYMIDEKQKQAHLTEDGHEHVERLMTQAGLLNEGESLYDAANIRLMHHLNAALRAHALFKREVDYIVVDGEVVIVDEFTGRTMAGRRWSDGLHQAVEAKEGVRVKEENQTVASITFQNYFRIYEKLSGMTGTADTEAYEFQEIYGLEVVVIPTHKPMVRDDAADLVYLTEKDKFAAIIEDVVRCQERGQPVLVGTASIEASEYLDELLKKAKIRHQVLNAKHHESEAEIITQAGRPGSVTVATNMAGRGTDIVLGGSLAAERERLEEPSEEQLAEAEADWQARHEKVLELGGLHIIGTERHESRRIDNQLRGRSGRQGDPGSSRFYLSMEDNLMRIFGDPERTKRLLSRAGMKEGEAIESGMLSRQIERAQKKVEAHNFDIRKQLLEYDDVANAQRKVVYQQRAELMEAEDVAAAIKGIRSEVVELVVGEYVPHDSLEEMWDKEGLTKALDREFGIDLDVGKLLEEDHSVNEMGLKEHVLKLIEAEYQTKTDMIGESVMRDLEKGIMLRQLDQQWKDHIGALDYLRQGIHLRGYAQVDPKQEYKREAFEMFSDMLDRVKHDTIAIMSRVQIRRPEDVQAVEGPATTMRLQAQHAEAPSLVAPPQSSGHVVGPGRISGPMAGGARPEMLHPEAGEPVAPYVREQPKVGRNEPCPCGSGKKYKQCHGKLA